MSRKCVFDFFYSWYKSNKRVDAQQLPNKTSANVTHSIYSKKDDRTHFKKLSTFVCQKIARLLLSYKL